MLIPQRSLHVRTARYTRLILMLLLLHLSSGNVQRLYQSCHPPLYKNSTSKYVETNQWLETFDVDSSSVLPVMTCDILLYITSDNTWYVVRLSLGKRLVNLLPVAQRTNAFTNGVVGRTMGRWSWVRISRPPWKRFSKKSVFPHDKNLINRSPWVPRDYT